MKIFDVDPLAKNFILDTLDKNGKKYLHIFLTKKGCGGKSYGFALLDKKPESCESQSISEDGKEIVVEYKDLLFLFGSKIILRDNILERRIDIVNSKEGARCGCGESFS